MVPSLSLLSGFNLEFERSSFVFRCLLIVHLQIVVDRHILKCFATANMDVLLGFPVFGPSYQPRCCFFGSSVKEHVVVRIQNGVEIQFSPPFVFFCRRRRGDRWMLIRAPGVHICPYRARFGLALCIVIRWWLAAVGRHSSHCSLARTCALTHGLITIASREERQYGGDSTTIWHLLALKHRCLPGCIEFQR